MAYKDKDYRRKYYIANKEDLNKASKDWFNKNKEKHHLYLRNCQFKRLYGIDIKEYNKLFEKQEGRCMICRKHQNELSGKLHVDHNHKSNLVRGLLCKKCNVLIGFAEEDSLILSNAIKYLNI